MAVQFQVVQYGSYGTCVEMQNSFCKVIVTVDVGPRIIYYAMQGGVNFFREDIKLESREGGEDFDRFYYPGATWYHYGGHRLWFTPEKNPDTYYPDNDPVSWEMKGNALVLTPLEQIRNRIQYRIRITLEEQGTGLSVEHEIRNCSDDPRRLAPWTVTQMAPRGTAVIPFPRWERESLAPRQRLLLWDNTSIVDPRFEWRRDCLLVRQDPGVKDCIKLGVYNTGGRVFYRKSGYLCTIRFPFDEGKNYPDGGASFEMYCCSRFCELETLGEEVNLSSGEQVSHTVFFSLKREEMREN